MVKHVSSDMGIEIAHFLRWILERVAQNVASGVNSNVRCSVQSKSLF